MPTRCNIDLLLYAVKGSYMQQARYDEEYNGKPLKVQFLDHGYQVVGDICPSAVHTNTLGAVALAPMDLEDHAPLVIAFRGIKDIAGVAADIDLGARTSIGKEYRDEAYSFYQTMRKKYPDRRIILTGHSLGGYVAQYVALKAINERDDKNFSVRTFNSAPIDTLHEVGLLTAPTTLISDHSLAITRFRNYRLAGDVVSMIGERLGRTVTVSTEANPNQAHKLDTIRKAFPVELLTQCVDDCDPVQHLREQMVGVKMGYQARIDGQGFAGYRSGLVKLAIMNMELDRIINILDDNAEQKQERVISRLNILKEQMITLSGWFGQSEAERLVDRMILVTGALPETLEDV